MGRFNAVMEFFLCILSVAVISVGGVLIMQGKMDTVGLITFSLYITTFVNPVRKLSTFAELFANGTAGFARFVELMREEPAMQDADNAVTLSRVEGRIDVDHVSFAYQDDLDVLHDVDLHIRPGETVAVVGPSGGGKSTLCQLIPRFYDVTDGAVRIDGRDVREVTQESLRQNVGVVQQDVFLFAASILENIRYGRPGASEEEVARAAKLAEIYDDIVALPEGFNTYVGERGTLPLRRAEAAHLHRPHLFEGPAGADLGRGHLRSGLRDGGLSCRRPLKSSPAAGPPSSSPTGSPRSAMRTGSPSSRTPHHGTGQPRGADGEERRVRGAGTDTGADRPWRSLSCWTAAVPRGRTGCCWPRSWTGRSRRRAAMSPPGRTFSPPSSGPWRRISSVLARIPETAWLCQGGYDGAERNILLFLPD